MYVRLDVVLHDVVSTVKGAAGALQFTKDVSNLLRESSQWNSQDDIRISLFSGKL